MCLPPQGQPQGQSQVMTSSTQQPVMQMRQPRMGGKIPPQQQPAHQQEQMMQQQRYENIQLQQQQQQQQQQTQTFHQDLSLQSVNMTTNNPSSGTDSTIDQQQPPSVASQKESVNVTCKSSYSYKTVIFLTKCSII